MTNPLDGPRNVTAIGSCPVPFSNHEQVLLGHGSGGKMSAELIQRLFLPELGNDVLNALEDQATLELAELRPALSIQNAPGSTLSGCISVSASVRSARASP